jgi:DNA-binding NarL/FixJ family response regulator
MDHDPLERGTDSHAPVGPPQAQTCASPVRVLLAHRHSIFSQGLAALLSAQLGVEFLAQVGDGEAAWEAIRNRKPELALLDLALGKPSGLEVARRVHAAELPTRCLMLTTDADPSLAAQALRAGAAGCFIKDSGFEELMLALRSIDTGETFVSPSIATRMPAPPGTGRESPLSVREREIVRLVAAGQSSKAIARTLDISHQTVDTHRRRILKKLDLHSSAEVVRYAIRSGLLA